MAVQLNMKIGEELLALVDEAAGEQARNEFIAKVLADHLGRPELAAIPRKRMGRPRRERHVTAVAG